MKVRRSPRPPLAVWIVAVLVLGSAPAAGPDAATAEARPTEARAPDLGEAYRLLDMGRVREAQAHFRAIVAADPTNLSAREGLVWAYVKGGAWQEAAALADERLALSPDIAWRKRWIDVVMVLPARHAGALTTARALVRERPADAEAWAILARVLSTRPEGVQDAVEAYRAALKLTPGDISIRTQLAQTLVWSARYAEAIAEYRQVIAVAPDAGVREDLARALVSAGRYAEAVVEYQAVLARRPHDRELRRNLGRALSSANRPAEAMRIFDALIAENSGDAEALRGRASIARWDGDFETARRLLRRVAMARPGDPDVQRELKSVTPRAAKLTAARKDITVPLLCAVLGSVIVIGHRRRTLGAGTYLAVLLLTAVLTGAGLCWFYLGPWQ